MPVITPQDAPVFETPEATIRGLASPSRGADDVAAWRIRLEGESPRHSLSNQEVFVVLSGTLTARYDGHAETAGEGGALIVPPDTEFSLAGPGEAVCVFPAGATALLDGERITPPWAV
jgi:mannose-6-phosphate isomerase-like protein (cupin superfamily)